MDSSIILLLLAPVFLIIFAMECIYCYRKSIPIYSLKDTLANIALSLMYQVSDVLFTLLVIKTIYIWIFNHGLQIFSINSIWNIALLFLFQDFLYYWFHRAAHTVRWLWASHVTHHSSTKLNFSIAFRQSMTYPISGMWMFWMPLAYMGFNPDMIILVVALNLAFQFFIHTQIVKKIGVLEKIFNTPSHHRAHHGTNPQYIDKNYAGVLIIWDKIFGSFIAEKDVPNYGIVGQVYSYNPITLTFHEWRSMFSDVFRNKSLLHFIMPPSWNRVQQSTTQVVMAYNSKHLKGEKSNGKSKHVE
jgi:sterol desaturase/sphingolipid hydroxylase (fatty acid hydroxylase superfamily)